MLRCNDFSLNSDVMGQTRHIHDACAMSACPVRRGKAALFQWVQIPPGNRSSRKQSEQSWR